MADHTSPAPEVSVVITAYNEADTIAACIDSILVQTGAEFELVIVDDGSTDSTLAVLAPYRNDPRIRIHALTENRGVPQARNEGIKAGRGGIVVFIDADATAQINWLKHLLKSFEAPSVACVGGPDVAPEDDGVFALAVDFTLRSFIATGHLRRRTILARYSPGGCNLAIRRSVLNEVGLFDPRLDRRGEEKEMVQRIRRQGYAIVYAPEALIWHHRRATLGSFWHQTFLSGKARVDILRLAPDAIEPAHLFPALLTMSLSAAALSVPWWSATSIPALLIGTYAATLLVNGLLGTFALARIAPLGIVPITTAVVHFAYGSGLLVRATEMLAKRGTLRAKDA